MKVGVISDTHGLLRPEALAALQGCERIIHAGDIGSPDILEQLAAIAPLHVVRGNNDLEAPWAENLPDLLRFNLNGWQALLVHDIADVPDLVDTPVKLVITGHSHTPRIEWRGDQLYLNPGSAGRRRFKLPVTLAVIDVLATSMAPRLISLVDEQRP
ncbi:metallophosphoesterase family protein [Rhodococcus sp. IEGM1300]